MDQLYETTSTTKLNPNCSSLTRLQQKSIHTFRMSLIFNALCSRRHHASHHVTRAVAPLVHIVWTGFRLDRGRWWKFVPPVMQFVTGKAVGELQQTHSLRPNSCLLLNSLAQGYSKYTQTAETKSWKQIFCISLSLVLHINEPAYCGGATVSTAHMQRHNTFY